MKKRVLFVAHERMPEEVIEDYLDYTIKRLSKRYPSMIGEDLDVSMGGLQPVPNSHLVNEVVVGCTTSELGYGFEIKIIENDDYRHPYFVRIMYGPYEYVKEDF